MQNKNKPVTLSGLKLDRQADQPLHRQLYHEVRRYILSGQLPPGSQLPATRILSGELGLSRSTVVEAIAQLKAEGYVSGQTGRGTFVSDMLPELMLTVSNEDKIRKEAPQTRSFQLSNRGRLLSKYRYREDFRPIPFRPGLPDMAAFPMEIWRKLWQRHLKNPPTDYLGYYDPAGYFPLREAIADHVRLSRGVRCTAEQVVMTAGSQQALYLSAQLLTQPGEEVWLENPGYVGARSAFEAAGLELVPVPVDGDGVDVEAGMRLRPNPRLIYVTPSHQYPVGGTLALSRRIQLLEWAQHVDAIILEDDYDSEYRYTGRPLASLQGLDTHGRVIYIGTFSKVMFPGLRLGYQILPAGLSRLWAAARNSIDRGSEMMVQLVLNDFIREGHFLRHIRRMRQLYAARQQALIDAIGKSCDHFLEVSPSPAGLHLLGWLPPGVDDGKISAVLKENGLDAPPLSDYSLTPLDRGGLVLGYAAVPEPIIRSAVAKIGRILSAVKNSVN